MRRNLTRRISKIEVTARVDKPTLILSDRPTGDVLAPAAVNRLGLHVA
jgi:hypothetical protein